MFTADRKLLYHQFDFLWKQRHANQQDPLEVSQVQDPGNPAVHSAFTMCS